MNHKTAAEYRHHLQNDNHAAARALIQPHALPLYYVAELRDFAEYRTPRPISATMKAPADATPEELVRTALAILHHAHLTFTTPRLDNRDTVARRDTLELRVSPHNTTRSRPDQLDAAHPLAPYHAAARFRLAHQADKDRHHRDPKRAATLATARANLRPGILTYSATLEPKGPTATIQAPADATRRQLIQLAKTALRCTGHPFRPLEYIDPPRITARAQGITLNIRPDPRPAPVPPAEIGDDEV